MHEAFLNYQSELGLEMGSRELEGANSAPLSAPLSDDVEIALAFFNGDMWQIKLLPD